jgi:hypothetical protein
VAVPRAKHDFPARLLSRHTKPLLFKPFDVHG